jgi:putative hemolysin
MWGLEIAVMLCMILLNGLFAAYEIALASIPVSRLQVLMQANRRGARAALAMKQKMEGSLAVVQLGINFVGAIAAATGGAGAEEQISPKLESLLGISSTFASALGVALVVIPLTVVTIIFGELIPKVFALRNQEIVCLRLSPALQIFSYTVWPIVGALEWIVRGLLHWGERFWRDKLHAHGKPESMELQELRASVAIARTSRLIGTQEEKIILGAAGLSNRPVRDIMLPAEFISLLDINSSPGDALIAAHLDMHTRFPVTEMAGDPQGIVGYVMFKDIVAHLRFTPHEPSIRAIVRRIASYPASMPVAQVLERLIREHTHIALVRDQEQRVVGMVTMEDMIEELVGDIEDEYDRLPAHVVATGRGWIVGGGVSLESLRKQTSMELQQDAGEQTFRTLSDWIAGHVDGPIHGSEVIEAPAAKVTVRKSRRHKVMEAFVAPKELAAPSAG